MAEHKPSFHPRILRTYAKWVNLQEAQVVFIQRWWRHWRRLRPANTTDCITLEPLEPPLFVHISDSGHVTAFSALSLAQYMVSSGDFKHPQFRTPFNVVELRRLDKCTQYKFNLVQNQSRIQAEQATAQSETNLDDFLVNDFTSHIQTCLDLCAQPQSYLLWALGMRDHTEPLLFEYLSLYTHNQELARVTLQRSVELVERRGLEVLHSTENLATYIDLYDRFIKFVLLLKTFEMNQ